MIERNVQLIINITQNNDDDSSRTLIENATQNFSSNGQTTSSKKFSYAKQNTFYSRKASPFQQFKLALSPVLGEENLSIQAKEDEDILPSIDGFTKDNRDHAFKSPKRQRRYTIQHQNSFSSNANQKEIKQLFKSNVVTLHDYSSQKQQIKIANINSFNPIKYDEQSVKNLFKYIYENTFESPRQDYKNTQLTYIKVSRTQLKQYFLQKFTLRTTETLIKYLGGLTQIRYDQYESFVRTISSLSNEQAIQLIFYLYDQDGDKLLGQKDFFCMMKDFNKAVQEDMLKILKFQKEKKQYNGFPYEEDIQRIKDSHSFNFPGLLQTRSPKKTIINQKKGPRGPCLITLLHLSETSNDEQQQQSKVIRKSLSPENQLFIDLNCFKQIFDPGVPKFYHQIIEIISGSLGL